MSKRKLSDGEKMVWAATFALNYNKTISNPPNKMVPNTSEWLSWNREQLGMIVEECTHAIRHLRSVHDEVLGVVGKHSESYRYLLQMLMDD